MMKFFENRDEKEILDDELFDLDVLFSDEDEDQFLDEWDYYTEGFE